MGKRGLYSKCILLLTIGAFLIFCSNVALAANTTQPVGPDSLIQINSTRLIDNIQPTALDAEAGNVSFIAVEDVRQTDAWQAYFGNVSGTITLDDSANNTFFDWSIPNPSGEVYAANRSNVAWLEVYCLNVTQGLRNGDGDGSPGNPVLRRDSAGVERYASSVNSSLLELSFGINATDNDGLNETFTAFLSTQVEIGPTVMDEDNGCSMAEPYINDNPGTGWQEIILSDNDSLVFASILRDDATGFDGQPVDFQMMVLEDGHNEQALITTSYYFFVELS